jgi:chaperone modulatory protein CbpM
MKVMSNENLIPAHEFCIHHNIEISFIDSLQEYGLVELHTMEGAGYINEEQLEDIEKMVRLHYDLNINLEGIDAITHLLHHMHSLQQDLAALRNRLRLYEPGD